ncbi:MAG: hypothetical protein HY589_00420 [Candidatus Omnitrophica bacterium]|nr:hypothetical protein [Candidatus Omnitrophota bacterium]
MSRHNNTTSANAALKFKIKMQFLITLPVIFMGIIITAVAFNSTKSVMETTKEQLKVHEEQITATYNSLNVDYKDLNEEIIRKAKKNLAQLREDFSVTLRLHAIHQAHGKDAVVYRISGIILLFSIILMIYLHRLVGPVFRLQRLVELIVEGKDVGEIKVRATDEVQHMAKALERLRQEIKELRKLKPLGADYVKK